jgi:ubiquinone/menaquinone biosynthesis C-methylase UbiE
MRPSTGVLLDADAVLAKAGIRAGATVADLGCGAVGHFVLPAAKLVGPSGKVYAVDIVKSVLDSVSARAKSAGLASLVSVWGNCERANGVRIGTNSVDVTLVINNLYQAQSRLIFLREAARLTKVGGTVVIIDWKTTATPLGPPIISRVAPEAVKAEAAAAGLAFLGSWEPGPYHWGLIYRK